MRPTVDNGLTNFTNFTLHGDLPSVVVITSHRPQEIELTISEMSLEWDMLEFDATASPSKRISNTATETRKYIVRNQPDFIILDCLETIGAAATAVASHYDIPILVRLVGNPWRKIQEERIEPARKNRDPGAYIIHRLSAGFNQYIFSRAYGFIVVSSELVEVVRQQTAVPENRICVLPIPIQPTESKASLADQLISHIDTDQLVLTVTNLKFEAKLNGVKTILSELEPVLQSNDITYLVAGGGQYHTELVAWINNRFSDPHIRQRIIVPGYVENVQQLYNIADIFVYVSYLDGYPNVILEAKIAGLPIVANAAHGMIDQLNHGETGLLINPEYDGELQSAVEELLSDSVLRNRLGTKAKVEAFNENDPTTVGRHLQNFLVQLPASS